MNIPGVDFSDPYTIFIFALILFLVIFPLGYAPAKFAAFVRRILERALVKKEAGGGVGYRFFGEAAGFNLFLPATVTDEFLANEDKAELYVFRAGTKSRRAFQIRFCIEVLVKLSLHVFYMLTTAAFCHSLHLLLVQAGISTTMRHLEVLTLTGLVFLIVLFFALYTLVP